MKRLCLAIAMLMVFWASSLARAEDYEASGGTEHSYRHGGQFKIYTQLGDSYRLIFRYNKDDFCGEAGKSFCRSFTPPWIEVGAGYGITDSFELLADIRIGLGDDFVPSTSTGDAPRQFVIAPGIRVFIDDTGSVKFFSTFQLAIDTTDFSADGVSTGADIGLRNVNGLLIDLHRTFGVYVHVGDTFAFVRWFRFEIDAGIGLMIRLP